MLKYSSYLSNDYNPKKTNQLTHSTTVTTIVRQCREACENTAVAAGFPIECGAEIYNGCLQAQLESWSDQQFQAWFDNLEAKYSFFSCIGISLIALYRSINKFIGVYSAYCCYEVQFLPSPLSPVAFRTENVPHNSGKCCIAFN